MYVKLCNFSNYGEGIDEHFFLNSNSFCSSIFSVLKPTHAYNRRQGIITLSQKNFLHVFTNTIKEVIDIELNPTDAEIIVVILRTIPVFTKHKPMLL
jgi:hypothetical protein